MFNTEFRTLRFSAVVTLALLILGSGNATAQDMNSLHGRLSPMPVTAATVKTITGQGQVTARLNGTTLTIEGNFEGMNSPATMAHIHMGPKAVPGPVILRLDVSAGTSGTISGNLTLSPEQVRALHAESLYVQIHSESNPEGELRGWLTH
tara:strand:- start:301 stop:750 length:450 start_codon:yes stop_codon:yes gene_type:complete